MKFQPVELQRGSDITFTVRRWARESRPFISIIHLAFTGTYRLGSGGAPDAHYISGIRAIVEGAWQPSAIILDFSSLTYEWGDEMEFLLPEENDRNAVIVSDKCRRAISTLCFGLNTTRDVTELSNYLIDFGEALKYVAQRQIDRWNEWVTGSDDSDVLITLADFGLDP